MGIWKEHLHWSVLLKWPVLGALVSMLLAIGGLMPDQYRLAKACFIAAGLLSLAKITQLAINAPDPTHTRLLFAAVGYAAVAVILISLIRGVMTRQRTAQVRSAPPVTETTASTSFQRDTPPTPAETPKSTATISATASASVDTGRVPGSHSNPLKTDPMVIAALYDAHTTLKADLLFSQYKGKWIFLSGKIIEVIGHEDYVQVLLGDILNRPLVSMRFESQPQRDAVALLDRGDTIAAVCRIQEAQPHAIFVVQCELSRND